MNMDHMLRDLRRRAMYTLGYTDKQVADAEKITKNSARDWRTCRGIKPNIIKTNYKDKSKGE